MKRVKIEIFKSKKSTAIYISNNEGDGILVAGSVEISSKLVDSFETDVEELNKAINEMNYTA